MRPRFLTPDRPRCLWFLTAVRTLWGTVLLVVPEAILQDLPHERVDRPARVVARVLGLRHLTEAAVTGRRNSSTLIRAGAIVDAIHATTFAALAALRPDRRKLALTNVATASALAAAGVIESRRCGSDV